MKWVGPTGHRTEVDFFSLAPEEKVRLLTQHPDLAPLVAPAPATPPAGAPSPSSPEGEGPSSIIEGRSSSFAALGIASPAPTLGRPERRPSSGRPFLYDRGAHWDAFWAARDKDRAWAQARLSPVLQAADLVAAVTPLKEALAAVAESAGVSPLNLRNWWYRVQPYDRADWLPALLPLYKGRPPSAACHEDAMAWLKGHYLQRSQPRFADTYRRIEEIAEAQGWKIPGERTLKRRFFAAVDPLVVILKREGPEALREHLPSVRVDKSHLAAGEACVGDGLNVKLYVRWRDGDVGHPVVWPWADVYSGKILAHRFDKTECTDLFRLSCYDLFGVCHPKTLQIDNTRTAANKTMTGQSEGRHRFSDDPERDPIGILTLVGTRPYWTNPDQEEASPGQKLIERWFGIGGIHEGILHSPRLEGRGFSTSTAIPVELFAQILDEEVARFNARRGRRTDACQGKLSLNEAWDKRVEERGLRVCPESVRRLFLLRCEPAHVNRDTGEIALEAGANPLAKAKNRYYHPSLMRFAGEYVTAYYDPDNLSQDVIVHEMDGKLICNARHLPGVAYGDTATAQDIQRERKRVIKATKKAAEAETRMKAKDRSALAARYQPKPPAKPKLLRAAFEPKYRKVGRHLVDNATGEFIDPETGEALEREPIEIKRQAAAPKRRTWLDVLVADACEPVAASGEPGE